MYKFDQYKANQKWMHIIKGLSLNDDHNNKMCKFAELFSLNEDTPYSTLSGVGMGNAKPPSLMSEVIKEEWKSLLPINLKVLCKIKNLDKIEIMWAPRETFNINGKDRTLIVGTTEFKVSIQRDALNSNLTMEELMENSIVNEVSHQINELIDTYGVVYLYQPISRIQIIAEKTIAPVINITSRLTYISK